MATSSGISVVFALCLVTTLLISSVSAIGHHDGHLGWVSTRSGCRGTIAECLDADEFQLDSDSNRRILATNRYISYGALQRNNVPCSRRGASYYNCRRSGQANPYSRGCSAITRCRR